MNKTGQFSEFEDQNFLQVKFNKTDFDEASSDEAYLRYKKNVIKITSENSNARLDLVPG